jgi:REP element-mobilizing transposase RayT
VHARIGTCGGLAAVPSTTIPRLLQLPQTVQPEAVGSTLIEQKCTEKGWEILGLSIQPDHIHLFVRVWPTDSAADVVKECKGLTAHHLRKKYAGLRRLPSLDAQLFCFASWQCVSRDYPALHCRSEGAVARCSKPWSIASWGVFAAHLTSKAANAGRAVVFVNPAYTSRTCSACGQLGLHPPLWRDCVGAGSAATFPAGVSVCVRLRR